MTLFMAQRWIFAGERRILEKVQECLVEFSGYGPVVSISIFGLISDACPPDDINLWCESIERCSRQGEPAPVSWEPVEPRGFHTEPTRAHEPATQVITNSPEARYHRRDLKRSF